MGVTNSALTLTLTAQLYSNEINDYDNNVDVNLFQLISIYSQHLSLQDTVRPLLSAVLGRIIRGFWSQKPRIIEFRG